MSISQLADQLAITPEAIRYYVREGLLHPGKKMRDGSVHYKGTDRARLRFILGARQLGFSVRDIREIMGEASNPAGLPPSLRRLIEERLAENEQRFNDMVVLREQMLVAVKDWNREPDREPSGKLIYALMEDLTN